ncbi:ArsR family transcriptional regulator [Photobacterium sp. MCCC 1A19761]|uniref:ArsR/SmtB family transcription factor n=1 Tax=Photobacterium sp. MCCC 1A19761 TaxID=3115000 RepID=UPI00307F6A88
MSEHEILASQPREETLEMLKALAHPVRLKIIIDLINDEPNAERHCTSFDLSVSKATRSHHFKILKDSGLIEHVDHGNRSLAKLRHAEIESKFPGLLSMLQNK